MNIAHRGTLVLQPRPAGCRKESGFYPRAIVSLDFASLYPSITTQYQVWKETPGEEFSEP